MPGAAEIAAAAQPRGVRADRWWVLPAIAAVALVVGLALALWAEAGEAVFVDRLASTFANCL